MLTSRATRWSACVLSLLIAPAAAAAAADAPPKSFDTLVVSAGDIDRTNTVVTFGANPALAGSFVDIAAEGGPTLPVEVRPDGRASFVLPALKAGQSMTFRRVLIKRSENPPATAVATTKAGAVAVTVGGRDVFVYRGEKTTPPEGIEPVFARGGYLHPLVTPGGVTVTDDYPKNHKHHHGVWSPWTSTQFEGRKPDFWNMGQKTGTVEFVELGQTWSGRVVAGFTARHRMVDLSAKPDPKPAINETWQVDAYDLAGKADAKPAYHVFDWQSTQTTASASPLVLPKYHYGGLGFRGHAQWDGEANSQFLSSEGKVRKDGNETQAKWVVNYGKVDGKPAYAAILCSPENFRFPQPIRFHPKEPFVCWVPQQLGEFSIEPGKPYVMKYRFVIGDGEPDKTELDRLWADYASPAKVEVK